MVEGQRPAPGSGDEDGAESVLTFAGIVANAGIAFVVTWLIARGLGQMRRGRSSC